MKIRVSYIVVALITSVQISNAYAQDEVVLNNGLKTSKVCEPMGVDAVEVAKVLGFNVPDNPLKIDTGARWDKDFHVVKPGTFTVDASRIMKAELLIDCRPSEEGEIIKLIGKKPEELRLIENASCQATVGPSGEVPDLNCTVSGAVGEFLSKITDMNEKLKPVFQAALTGT